MLKEDKMGKQLLSFIEEKGVMLIASMGSKGIKSMRLKDIDLVLSDNESTLNGKVINLSAELDSYSNINLNMDECSVNLNDESVNFNCLVTEIKYILEKINDLNLKNNFSVGFIELKNNDSGDLNKNQNFVLNNLSYKVNIDTKENKVNSDIALNIETVKLTNNFYKNSDLYKIDTIVLNSAMNGLDEKTITELTKTAKTETLLNEQELQKRVQTLLNKGFSFNIDTLKFEKCEIKSEALNCDIDKVTFNSKLNLKNNTLDFNKNSPIEILQYVNADAHLNTKKTNLDYFLAFFNVGNSFDKYIHLKKGNAFVDAELKDSVVTVNKQRVF